MAAKKVAKDDEILIKYAAAGKVARKEADEKDAKYESAKRVAQIARMQIKPNNEAALLLW